MIVIPVFYNGNIPLNFIFDTGAEHIILFNNKIHEVLGLGYERKINLLGADLTEEINAFISRNIPLKLSEGQTVTRDIVILEDDLMERNEIFGLPLDGVLGAGMFNNLVVHIDYDRQVIELHSPIKFEFVKKLKKHHAFDLEIHNQKPYINAIVQHSASVIDTQKFLIDTGAGLGLLLHHDQKSSQKLPEHLMSGSLGIGLSGVVEGYIGKVKRLNLGPFYFSNLLTQFQQFDSTQIKNKKIVRQGIIGNLLLSRFDIYIDYLNRKFYLKARKDYNKAFEYDKSGLLIYAFGEKLNEFYIKKVFPNTPASEAGLMDGDIIRKIGWWASRFYNLEKISKKLSDKAGKTIKMNVLRDDVEFKVEFKLRDLLDAPEGRPPPELAGKNKACIFFALNQ